MIQKPSTSTLYHSQSSYASGTPVPRWLLFLHPKINTI
nr:MAG TPA: hypothetical protein [Caudoviricetes sp.]